MNLTTLLNTLSSFDIEEESFQFIEEEFDPKSLIGRSIIAKKWNKNDVKYDPRWTESMEDLIGKEGVIELVGTKKHSYSIVFDNDRHYWFPIDFTRTLLI